MNETSHYDNENKRVEIAQLKAENEKLKSFINKIKQEFNDCSYYCMPMNNCSRRCKHYNECNGEFSYILNMLCMLE